MTNLHTHHQNHL